MSSGNAQQLGVGAGAMGKGIWSQLTANELAKIAGAVIARNGEMAGLLAGDHRR
jgi:hypothetical protein